MSDEEYNKKIILPIRLRVCNAISIWLKGSLPQELSLDLLTSIKDFCQTRLENDGLSQLINANYKQLDRLSQMPFTPLKIENKTKVRTCMTLKLESISAEDIASQLTIIDFDIYSSIQFVELLKTAWTKPELKHKCQNVHKLITRFNEITGWIAFNILFPETVQGRANQYIKSINIARELLRLGNMNSLMAVYAGLNSAPIHRLKFTLAEVPKKDLQFMEELDTLLSSTKSYSSYRQFISTKLPPLIPFIGVWLSDLVFINDGNEDEIDGKINFAKVTLNHKILSLTRYYQQTPFEIKPKKRKLDPFSNN